ncbi:MAG: cation:dicarboxylase symporter family transporter, partial [Deltaproteobacteria bacterium]|nr:cation:dicarboxylase symporter family transporter [Deltaproteobacteria bacterium]
MSLSAQILVAMLLGLAAGLFFGELVESIKIVGDGFILLLQMTVLPYVSVSLVSGLGSLRAEGAAALAVRAGTALLVLWSLAFLAILTIPFAFPDWESASFFSTNLVETAQSFDFLGLFIPSNPFHSLSASIVPSVVVFSVALGVALIGVAEKEGLIQVLDTLKEALSRITTFVVRLAPYGVFAIATHAAGTLSLSQAASLQVYMIVYASVALVLALWAVPGLVAALTPYTWWEVIGRMRGVLITAFATGNLFVVLSVLTERIKELVRERGRDPERASHFVEVVVPVAFTFPSVGKLLSLSFILFAGWISGYSLSVAQYPSLLAAGVASYFGATVVAIPFLLDLFQIPSDTFQLFLVADNVVGLRFSTMLGAVHLIAISLLTSAAMEGQVRFRPIALLRYLTITLLLVFSVILGIRFAFESMGHEYEGYNRFIGMQPTQNDRWPKVLEAIPEPASDEDLALTDLDRILARGTIRVGYLPDRLPWAFRNQDGRLVGFDVEMAHVLANELGVDVEFIRVDREELVSALTSGAIDVGMSGIPLTTQSLERLSFSKSYVDETIAFI